MKIIRPNANSTIAEYARYVFDPDTLRKSNCPYLSFPVNLEEVTDIQSFVDECEKASVGSKVAGAHRLMDWEVGWGGKGIVNAEMGAPEDDLPYYFKKNTHLRLRDRVFRDWGGYAEFAMLRVLQSVVFSHFRPMFSGLSTVIEYGCGTGHNIRFLKKQFPDIPHWGGGDWSESAVVRTRGGGTADPAFVQVVDYFRPETFWAPSTQFLAFTNASLEQTGTRHKEFIEFLASNAFCIGGIHIEPIRELLGNSVLDRNSFRYSEMKGFLQGFVDTLMGVGDKNVKLLMAKDYGIGSRFISGYQVVVWAR